MSAIVRGGTSGIDADVDTTAKALRVALYAADGAVLLRNVAFGGIALVNVRQSAATGAGASVWAIHNPSSTKIVYIKRLRVRCFFDGTAAATLMRYEVIKATGVTAFSGGAVVTPLNKQTGLTQVSSVRVLDTGLTLTGATFTAAMGHIPMGRVTQTTTNFQSTQEEFDFGTLDVREVQLAQNEALAIRQTVTSVIGDNIIGNCDFIEV